ncbi:MAG: MFS transporter, partial [Parvularculaceae bacterium]|nr:MFS transporter [Parvularculaceae bacterium]
MSVSPSSRLTNSRLALYAAPWFATQVVFLPLINFVPGHYSSELGLPLFAVSLAMLGSRFADMVVDPLIGAFSDRLRTPLGRRKPVILAGAPILILGAWLAFAPPPAPSPLYLFLALTVLFFGFALIQIPYVSWGAELSDDYDERSRVVGWREGVGVLGTLAAISSPLVAQMLGKPGLGVAMFAIAAGVTILLPLLLAPAIAFVPERRGAEPKGAGLSALGHIRATFGNRELVWFLAVTFITFVGVAPGGAVGYLMMKHLFNAESLYPVMVLGEFVTMLISVPLWAHLAGRLGKHRAMAASLAWMSLWTLPVPFLGGIDPHLVVAATAIRGLGFGAAFVIPYSMVA